tara:strand:+ start:5569 stop:6585 length:1017 start_codon:yes stop_codon:yes gene_type:complete
MTEKTELQVKVVLLGAPVFGLMGKLQSHLSGKAEISFAGYEETAENIRAMLKGASVLVTNRFSDRTLIPESLKLLQLPGAGADEIDLDAIPEHVQACNVYEHETGVAEFVVASLLQDTWHHLSEAERLFKSGSWEKSGRSGGPAAQELSNKTLGIVGTGRIGKAVASRAKSFGMKVTAANRSLIKDSEKLFDCLYNLDELEALMSASDYVVVCCALTEDTVDLISERELRAMKPTSYLINVSRGPVINEFALHKALKDKWIRGAHIDVWYKYPNAPNDHPLPSNCDFASLQNVRMTPHLAGWTEELIDRRTASIAENILSVLGGGIPRNIIRDKKHTS